jgi:hypothetical protein
MGAPFVRLPYDLRTTGASSPAIATLHGADRENKDRVTHGMVLNAQ